MNEAEEIIIAFIEGMESSLDRSFSDRSNFVFYDDDLLNRAEAFLESKGYRRDGLTGGTWIRRVVIGE